MLKNDRVDFVVDTKSAVDFAWIKISSDKLVRYEPAIDSMPLFHYINSNHKNLYPKLTQALKQMEKKGTIKKLSQISE